MREKGFTLVELIFSLLVFLLLLQGGLTFANQIVPNSHLVNDTNQILSLLYRARAKALMHQPVMVCASGSRCKHFGNTQNLILAIDNNHNSQRDNNEKILATTHLHESTHVSWHSFRNQPQLTYLSNGTAYFQNGHLLVCGKHAARKVVVNWIGRPHTEKVDHFHTHCTP